MKPERVAEFRSSVDVPVSDLRTGMFVVKLDRPWEETPFLLQGFVIQDVEEIATLKRLCYIVVVDPRRSDPDSLRHLPDIYALEEVLEEKADEGPAVRIRYVDTPSANDAHANPPKPDSGWASTLKKAFEEIRGNPVPIEGTALRVAAREATERVVISAAPVTLKTPSAVINAKQTIETPLPSQVRGRTVQGASQQSEMQARKLIDFEDVVARVFSGATTFGANLTRLGHMATHFVKSPRERRARPTRSAIRWGARSIPGDAVPQSVELVIYRDRTTLQAELPPARSAIENTEEILGNLRRDLAIESALHLDGLPESVDALIRSAQNNPDALLWISRVRERSTVVYSRSIRVAVNLIAFGRHLGFQSDELRQLAVVGLLMDLGKLKLDPALLESSEALSETQRRAVQEHVGYSLEMLDETGMLDDVSRAAIAQHHEWVNGAGYPMGLVGDQISLFARLASIADAYSALTSVRSFAPPLASYDALRVIYGMSGVQFHAPLVEQFVQAIGVFPIGSLVLLNSEQVAVVVAHHRDQRLEPRVLVLTDPDKLALQKPYEVDLRRKSAAIGGEPIRILRGLPVGAHGVDFRNFYIG